MSCQPTFDELISGSLAALEGNDQTHDLIRNNFNQVFGFGGRYQKVNGAECIDDFLVDYRPDILSILLFMSQLGMPDSAPYQETSYKSYQNPTGIYGPASSQELFASPIGDKHTPLYQESHNSAQPFVNESKQDRRRRQNRESQQRRRQKIMRLDVKRLFAGSRSLPTRPFSP